MRGPETRSDAADSRPVRRRRAGRLGSYVRVTVAPSTMPGRADARSGAAAAKNERGGSGDSDPMHDSDGVAHRLLIDWQRPPVASGSASDRPGPGRRPR